ncbi:hypothetical protein KBD45_02525 [Candidatus Dojkabacteria bacterium]|nr:hypothetical protein [Candidatus Dojkabacteria bacterium]
MNAKTALKSIFGLAIAGTLFSGYLTYYELFVPAGCSEAIISCGTKNVTIANLPACVYGFIMYVTILTITSLALFKKGGKQS